MIFGIFAKILLCFHSILIGFWQFGFSAKESSGGVTRVLIWYDQEKHIKMEKAESYQDGIALGEERGKRLGQEMGQDIINSSEPVFDSR